MTYAIKPKAGVILHSWHIHLSYSKLIRQNVSGPGLHTPSQEGSSCLLCAALAGGDTWPRKTVSKWLFSSPVPSTCWLTVAPTCWRTVTEGVLPETEQDALMASGAASHTPVCSNRTGDTGIDHGPAQEQTLPPASGKGAEAERRSGGGCKLSDDRDRVWFPLHLQYPARSPAHSNPPQSSSSAGISKAGVFRGDLMGGGQRGITWHPNSAVEDTLRDPELSNIQRPETLEGGRSAPESGVLRPGSDVKASEGVWREQGRTRGRDWLPRPGQRPGWREGSRSWEKPSHESWTMGWGLEQQHGWLQWCCWPPNAWLETEPPASLLLCSPGQGQGRAVGREQGVQRLWHDSVCTPDPSEVNLSGHRQD